MLGVTDTMEAAFKDAVDVLGVNLRILGNPRAAFSDRDLSAVRGDADLLIDREACTFVLDGTPHLVYLLGPTGKDRGDNVHNALWLEPVFVRVRAVAPVLAAAGFLLDDLGLTMSAIIPSDVGAEAVRALPAARRVIMERINAVAFALHGAKGVIPSPADNPLLIGDMIEVEGPSIEREDRGGRGGGKFVTETLPDGWRVRPAGNMGDRSDRAHRLHLTSVVCLLKRRVCVG